MHPSGTLCPLAGGEKVGEAGDTAERPEAGMDWPSGSRYPRAGGRQLMLAMFKGHDSPRWQGVTVRAVGHLPPS